MCIFLELARGRVGNLVGVLPAESVSLRGTILVSEGPRAGTPWPLSRGISFCAPPFLWLVTLCVLCVCCVGACVDCERFIQGTYISNFPRLFRRTQTTIRIMTTITMMMTNTTTIMAAMIATGLVSASANILCV